MWLDQEGKEHINYKDELSTWEKWKKFKRTYDKLPRFLQNKIKRDVKKYYTDQLYKVKDNTVNSVTDSSNYLLNSLTGTMDWTSNTLAYNYNKLYELVFEDQSPSNTAEKLENKLTD